MATVKFGTNSILLGCLNMKMVVTMYVRLLSITL